MRRAADEPLGELDERCEPALEDRPDLWRRRFRRGFYSCPGTAAVRVADDEDCRNCEWSDGILE